MAWGEFGSVVCLFLLTHALPVRPPLRPWLVARLGTQGFTLAYSVLSFAMLAWLIAAAGRAPFVPLWEQASWQRHLPILAMLPACLILGLAIARPNPFSFGGTSNVAFDPAHPGIIRWMRHPLLVALAIWTGAHLVANGDLAHALLFGLFLIFALVGMRMIDRRRQRDMGARWHALVVAMAAGPIWPRPANQGRALLRLCLGLGLYGLLLTLHPAVIGVSPWP